MKSEPARRRRGRPDILTPREWQVLALIREGLTNERIAERLDISLATAKYHVFEILSKLGVATRDEAAAWQPSKTESWWRHRVLVPLAAALRRAAPLTIWKAAAIGGAVMLTGLALLAIAEWLGSPGTEDAGSPEDRVGGAASLPDGRYLNGLYAVQPDGEASQLIYEHQLGEAYGGAYSLTSDGRWLALSSGGSAYLFSMTDPGLPRRLTSLRGVRKVELSLDGSEVLLTDGGLTYLVDTRTGQSQRLAVRAPASFAPGRRFAFARGTGEQATLRTANLNGTDERQILVGQATRALAPDGRRLAIAVYLGSNRGVYVADSEDNIQMLSLTSPDSESPIAWSPDGRYLAFVANGEIRVLDVASMGELTVALGSPAGLVSRWRSVGIHTRWRPLHRRFGRGPRNQDYEC